MSTNTAPPVTPVNFPSSSDEYAFKIGDRARVIRQNGTSSVAIGTIVRINNIASVDSGSSYPYYSKFRGDGSVMPSNYGFYSTDLEPVITIKAYAYLQRSTKEFHWFSSEKDRKGYERFKTHDVESYK